MSSNVYNSGIKYPIVTLKSPEEAYLKLIEPYWADKNFLSTGREHPKLKLRPREILGLIIMAHVGKYLTGESWVPGTDPTVHDGTVSLASGPRQGTGLVFEQVYVPQLRPGETQHELEHYVLAAIKHKADKGDQYRSNTNLVILVDRSGRLGDLRGLAAAIADYQYDAVYLLAQSVPQNGLATASFFCIILRSPADTLGPLEVSIDRKSGRATVSRVVDK